MKKIVLATFLLVAFAFLIISSNSYSADWSRYESGRNNIRLDGYQGQPGYIHFTDGNGNTIGYLYASIASRKGDNAYRLFWATPYDVDLTTTSLEDEAEAFEIGMDND